MVKWANGSLLRYGLYNISHDCDLRQRFGALRLENSGSGGRPRQRGWLDPLSKSRLRWGLRVPACSRFRMWLSKWFSVQGESLEFSATEHDSRQAHTRQPQRGG